MCTYPNEPEQSVCRCKLRTERPTQATTLAQRNLVDRSQNAPHDRLQQAHEGRRLVLPERAIGEDLPPMGVKLRPRVPYPVKVAPLPFGGEASDTQRS